MRRGGGQHGADAADDGDDDHDDDDDDEFRRPNPIRLHWCLVAQCPIAAYPRRSKRQGTKGGSNEGGEFPTLSNIERFYCVWKGTQFVSSISFIVTCKSASKKLYDPALVFSFMIICDNLLLKLHVTFFTGERLTATADSTAILHYSSASVEVVVVFCRLLWSVSSSVANGRAGWATWRRRSRR